MPEQSLNGQLKASGPIVTALRATETAIILIACFPECGSDGKQANYCEMRQIYIDSDSEYGWPKMDGYGECK